NADPSARKTGHPWPVSCRQLKQKPTKKPGVGRVFVKQRKKRATAYPAEISGPGRRAREVMPAAMRALVGPASIMEGVFITARTLAAIAAQCKPYITRPVRR